MKIEYKGFKLETDEDIQEGLCDIVKTIIEGVDLIVVDPKVVSDAASKY